MKGEEAVYELVKYVSKTNRFVDLPEAVATLQWWADYLTTDGKIERKRESKILACVADTSLKQAKSLRRSFLLPLNQGKLTPM